MSTDPKTSIIDSYKDYYRDVSGPIGGDDRFRWVKETFFGDLKGKRVLEIGCGEGSLLEMLSEGNRVYGVDISLTGVERARQKGMEVHHLDASNQSLPYENGFFDVVITLETIEHVENPHRMLWEIKRILKKDGALLISIPGERVYHPFIYPGLFTKKNFSEFLRSNGFEIDALRGWGQAPLLSHWSHAAAQSHSPFLSLLAKGIFYAGRKRNLLMRKHLRTPLYWAFCLNFLCRQDGKSISRVEEVARHTTPK